MIPLAMCTNNSEVKIHFVGCGQELKKRLCDFGIYNNTKIKVVKNDVSGPIIVKVKDTKIVLGRGQANKIFVEIKGD